VDKRLRRLQGLEREKIDAEYKELTELIEYLQKVLASEQMVKDIIKEELTEIKTNTMTNEERISKAIRKISNRRSDRRRRYCYHHHACGVCETHRGEHIPRTETRRERRCGTCHKRE
jgi:DNA gyrase/topoisomerase IV subunit A